MLFDTSFVTLPINRHGRDFVVGDLHGQARMLAHALELVSFDPKQDKLIALGDLVDRGGGSHALLQLVASAPWFISLRGNHEAMMLGARSSPEIRHVWNLQGSDWADALDARTYEQCCCIARGLPLAIELPLQDGRRVGLVHAEVPMGGSWPDLRNVVAMEPDAIDDRARTDAAAMLWGRRRVTAEAHIRYNRRALGMTDDQKRRYVEAAGPIAGIDLVIAGHTVLDPPLPRSIANLLFIDTGAYRDGGRLTMVEPLRQHYWQVLRTRRGPRAIRRKPSALPAPLPLPAAWCRGVA